jgi:PA14 domain
MRSIISKSALATLLLAFFVGCVQPPTPPNSGIEVSDENNNTVTTQAIPTNGLKGDYYDNLDFTGTMKTRYDATINKNFASSAPITGIQPTTYSVRWTGQIMPAFSQTYTFFVTSSDGARLMVNGQMLVNDWKDGSSRVRSGTVALQANTKYDIRLEYYRNAANPGSIKLEWQSSSRSRQVVPQASLFTTGSNLQAAITVIASNNSFKALGSSLDATKSSAILARDGAITVISFENASRGIMYGTVINNAVASLIRFSKNVQNGILTDVLTGETLDIGDMNQYFTNNAQTPTQETALRQRIIGFLSKGVLQVSATVRGSTVRPQGVISDISCLPIAPPPPCNYTDANGNQLDGPCAAKANAYKVAVCAPAALIEDVITLFLVPPAALTEIAFEIGVLGVVYGPGVWDGEFLWWNAWQSYLDCLKQYEVYCKVLLEVLPPQIDKTVALNQTGQESVVLRNPSPSNATLDAKYKFTRTDSSGGNSLLYLVGFNNQGESRILPGGTGASMLSFDYRCSATPATLQGNLAVTSNASNIPSTTVNVIIKCEGPKISVSPSTITRGTPINSSVTENMTVNNSGNVPLQINNILSGETWLRVDTRSFIQPIAPGESRLIPMSLDCGVTAQSLNTTLSVLSNDSSNPTINLPVSLKCLATTGFIAKYITLKITATCTISYYAGFYAATIGFRWDANPPGPGGYAGQLTDGAYLGQSSSSDGVSCPGSAAEVAKAQDVVLYSRVQMVGQPGPGFWVSYNNAMDFGRNLGYVPDYVYIW